MSLSDDHPPGRAEPRRQARQKRKPARARKNTPWLGREYGGEAWLSWEYSNEEWALFDRMDWGVRSLFFWGLLGSNIVFLPGVTLPWFLFVSDPVLFVGVFVLAALFFVGCLCLLIYEIPDYQAARRRHKARLNGPRTVLFSRNGVWEAGTFFPLHRSPFELAEVTLSSQPSVLHFRLAEFTWSGDDEYTYTTFMAPTLDVLVPRGQAREAGLLLKRFQAEVITTRKQEEERREKRRLLLEELVFRLFSGALRPLLWRTKHFDNSSEREGN